MKAALLLAPLIEGATPGEPFAWFHTDALPLPGETIAHDGTIYQVAMRAFTVKALDPDNPHMEYGLMVRRIGTVPKLAAMPPAGKA